MALTLKLVVGDETYRLPLTQGLSYKAVVQVVIEFLGPNAASLVEGGLLLKYADEDGDLCVFTAVTFTDWVQQHGGYQAKVLRLLLVMKEKTTVSNSDKQRVARRQQAFLDIAKKTEVACHHSMTCHDCKQKLLVGSRFRHNSCSEHDLCRTCYELRCAPQEKRAESFCAPKPGAVPVHALSETCKGGHEGLKAMLTLADVAAASARAQPNVLGALAAGLTLGALAASSDARKRHSVAHDGPDAVDHRTYKGDERAGSRIEGVVQHEDTHIDSKNQEPKAANASPNVTWGPGWEDLNEFHAKRIAGSADVKHKMWARLKADLDPKQRADEIVQIEAIRVAQAEHHGMKFKGIFHILTNKHPTTPFVVEAELCLSNARVWRVNTCRFLGDVSKPMCSGA
jgi:hypothetical protein